MIPNDIIRIKRNKGEIPAPDLKQFIWEYSHEKISDKEMTKLLKAIFKNGMTRKEIFALTESMIDSGEKMDFSFLSNYVADKHSTGGVGDKVSIILGPLMAAAGLSIPMISGRSLGHTGGTLDKLETIPGYRTNISLNEFSRNVHDIGISMIGKSVSLAFCETLTPLFPAQALREALLKPFRKPFKQRRESSCEGRRSPGRSSPWRPAIAWKIGSGAAHQSVATRRY